MRMKVAVTGSHGLVGTALLASLKAAGHEVVRVVRTPPESGSPDVFWDPVGGVIDAGGLAGVEAVVNLAGEWLGDRWTQEKKRKIRDSRIMGTTLLARTLAELPSPPKVLLNASAVGYYGNRGDEILYENSGPGSDFLAGVVSEWEASTEPAAEAGIRVVITRSGMVLSDEGGGLKKMLLPFRLGVGGKIANGKQWMSWVSLADEVAAMHFLLEREDLNGPFNVTAPDLVKNAEFTRTLGHVLKRPTPFRIPAVALRAVYGEMADATLLVSQKVVSDRLQAAGFQFKHPQLEEALHAAVSIGR